MDWNHGPSADLSSASLLGQSSSHVVQHLLTRVDFCPSLSGAASRLCVFALSGPKRFNCLSEGSLNLCLVRFVF